MSDVKKTIEINERATAKAVAGRVGVKWPEAQGKPPKSALWYKLTELGFEVTGTYLPKPKKMAPVPAGKREYEIKRTNDGKDEVIRVSIGELRTILHAEGNKGSLGDSRIREAVTKLREAKKLFVGWQDADIAKASITPVTVAVVEEPDANALATLDAVLTPSVAEEPKAEPAKAVEKAPVKPRTPRNSRAKGQGANVKAPATEKTNA